ncbi:MAG: ABC transporter ATP-binding protein [Myxococcales bacterium]|nr:ABC transporter ATP-binding protein [Deltaproteobacteria bacterium]NND29129.1 ABC transporter ATP-binding protein [Myxococcales bacterium]MBT8481262.1 ABC transporter ATP-binding protein [Deltaproteobacteria bacterium]NNK44950.1 ABC transporter ATP-binding protein [Myxococcales bacterium]NNL24126.1 ABC transporter ATP-binding protein [Myxococcales bacterium]
MTEPLLSLRHLVTAFETDEGYLRAVDDVSFDVFPGKTLGIVGESGCGKSVTSLSIMRLVPSPPGVIESGEALFDGRDLLRIPESEMRSLRGNEISMIFQEPMTSLNPVYTVGSQIIEAIRLHQSVSRRAAKARAVELLDLVGIPAPAERIDSYPHTLSGGMRQRAMIAMALSCEPRLLIADEPTTALDVTIQAQILDLLRSLQRDFGMSIVFITHDLGVMAEFAHEIAVMYAGKIVEHAETRALFRTPKHPYTKGLLRSLPSVRNRGERLPTIRGVVPDLRELPSGCRFQDRCDFVTDVCRVEEPNLQRLEQSDVACFHAEVST